MICGQPKSPEKTSANEVIDMIPRSQKQIPNQPNQSEETQVDRTHPSCRAILGRRRRHCPTTTYFELARPSMFSTFSPPLQTAGPASPSSRCLDAKLPHR
jgi:hypothetical protein